MLARNEAYDENIGIFIATVKAIGVTTHSLCICITKKLMHPEFNHHRSIIPSVLLTKHIADHHKVHSLMDEAPLTSENLL